jgi:hypothetical protein
MSSAVRIWLVAVMCVSIPCAARADSDSALPEATLFRVFLTNGTSVVSYGELARVDDRVVFSMPVGGSVREPRLHPVTLAASLVDWARTERYAASARYQQYAVRAEADYQRLTDAVAVVLNEVALSTNRERALSLAEQARRTLADWPRTHFGYRQQDVRDIITLIDGAIARLQGTPANTFAVSLVAAADAVEIEPLAEPPTPGEQLQQILRILDVTTIATDRVALLQSAHALLNENRTAFDGPVAPVRRYIESQLEEEVSTDQRYAKLTQKMLAEATRAAADARISSVERVLNRIPQEDKRLGRQRPEVVQALTTSIQARLDGARRLRLLRDQWTVRRSLFRDYQRSVGAEMLQLVKMQPSLEAIRKLEGPPPDRLVSLRTRLSGGAARLERMPIPNYLRSTHDLVITAWRFAEKAANGRTDAVASGNLSTAWEASSAAAGALMMLSRAQQEIRALLEPPKLQ